MRTGEISWNKSKTTLKKQREILMSPFWKVTPFQRLNWFRRFDTTNFGNQLYIEAYRTPKK